MTEPNQFQVNFYSYCRDLAGTSSAVIHEPAGSRLSQFMDKVYDTFPRLRQMDRSLLVAVGVEYQTRDYLLKPGDEISIFPPVQGG